MCVRLCQQNTRPAVSRELLTTDIGTIPQLSSWHLWNLPVQNLWRQANCLASWLSLCLCSQDALLDRSQTWNTQHILICCVCLGDNSEDADEIIQCDNCGVTVHEGKAGRRLWIREALEQHNVKMHCIHESSFFLEWLWDSGYKVWDLKTNRSTKTRIISRLFGFHLYFLHFCSVSNKVYFHLSNCHNPCSPGWDSE